MIEINLFEKKEKNILPYVVIIGFVVGIIALFIYFSVMINHFTRVEQKNNEDIQYQAEEVALSREIENTDRLINQNRQAINTLNENEYPIVFLIENIASYIPNEEEQVLIFEHTQTDQLYLLLENIEVIESSEVIAELETVFYIDRVNVTNLTQINLGNSEYQIELTLDINEELLRQEALE